MIYVIIYGCLAIATFAISLAPKAKSLWKVGLVFLFNWIITITVFSLATSSRGEAFISFGVDTLSAAICFIISDIYKCRTCKYVTIVYSVQAVLYLYMLFIGPSYVVHVALNAFFILNALIIIGSSIRTLISKDRRRHDVACFNRDRRINLDNRNQKNEIGVHGNGCLIS